jgi:2-dehydro-3-deoxyphosphogluconate aldolase / (4S)-4-hydroxy-2-oxoglutarate aldolase
MANSFDWRLFETLPIIGILRGYSIEEVEKIVLHCADGGLRNLEITMNSDNAAASIRAAKERAEGRMNLGAGTVCTLDDLDAALTAGATFIVTPIINAVVILACKKEKVPVIPGGFTPTEIYQAWQLGADMVKLFPANRFGPEYLKDIRGPLDRIKLVPTGGIDLENLPAYLENGAYGFGVGSPLFDKRRVEAGDWDWVKGQARRFAALYESWTDTNRRGMLDRSPR